MPLRRRFQTGLPAGTYCNAIAGELTVPIVAIVRAIARSWMLKAMLKLAFLP
uniref:Uncharacterized protein n=1 Tax=Desertifilum tharense IPPAS B-1220 TaxID=1781255 RepID=A0ACD5GPL1_9CYAN